MTRFQFQLVAGGIFAASWMGTALAQGDAGHGKFVFKACAACHAETAETKVGPGLNEVFGRTAGTVHGFRYSPAMAAWGQTWDDQTLDAFLAAPVSTVPGTTMIGGLPNAQDRADVIAYL